MDRDEDLKERLRYVQEVGARFHPILAYETDATHILIFKSLPTFSFCNDAIEDDGWVESALNEKWPPERVMAEFESRHSDAVDGLEEVLLKSLRKRVTKQPNLCKDCVARKLDAGDCDHAKIGILGRLDMPWKF